MLSSLILRIFSYVANRVPTTNIICFNSCPDYTDNAYAIFKYLYNNRYGNKFRFVWLVNEKADVSLVKKRIAEDKMEARTLYKMSIEGFWCFLRCRYCFYTHGIFESLYLKQYEDKMINMWHGMPLKNLGIADKKNSDYMHNADLMLANSIPFQSIMSRCFNIDSKKVLPIGQPRCDLLFEGTDFFCKHKIDKDKFDKIGIWLPTYRSSIVKEIRIDGNYRAGCISFMNEDDLSLLNKELECLNHLLIIKLHPMDQLQEYVFRNYSRIMIIKAKDLDCQLYSLLGSCDYLLTDFSSVCIDFDICKKPMGFPMDDVDAYKNSRGFLFDNIEDVLPGPILPDYEHLLNFIRCPFYKKSSLNLNSYYDNQASKRLVDYLGM